MARLGRAYAAKPWLTKLNLVDTVVFDAASNSTYKTAASTYSWSHTCTGSNRYLTVGISMLSVAGSSVSSITYNGVALSLIKAQASVSGAVRAELWGLIAPASGSNTIAVTLSASLDSIGGAVSFTGVHQVSPYEGANSATATNVGAADATVDVTTVSVNDVCIDVVASDDTAITVGTGQTSQNNVTGTLGSGAMSTEGPKNPSGAVTMSWTAVGALATWSIASVALRPIPALALSVTLTASKGTFTETGITALFKISEIFSKGTFTYTGVAAQQARPSGKGTFTETGINILFRINCVEGKGTFTETGKNALFDFSQPSPKGTFTETGQSTLFRINEVVGKGTFTLTGIDAILKIGTYLTAATGTFTMSGKNVLFQIDSVDSKGTFNLSGKSANLTPSMVSSKGTFVDTGKAVLFDIDMNMAKGTFTITGKDATLTDTGGPAISTASDIILLRRRRRS